MPIAIGTDVPVLDQSRLLDQFGEEPEVVAELRDLFLEDFPRQIEKIRSGLASGDVQTISRAAHSLKGASGTFGAERVYQAALAIERLARDGQLDGVSLGLDLLCDELAKVVVLINNLQPSG